MANGQVLVYIEVLGLSHYLFSAEVSFSLRLWKIVYIGLHCGLVGQLGLMVALSLLYR